MIERLTRSFDGASFHRGLALGALVGAAIAGSTLWARLLEARSAGRLGGTPAEPQTTKPRARDLGD